MAIVLGRTASMAAAHLAAVPPHRESNRRGKSSTTGLKESYSEPKLSSWSPPRLSSPKLPQLVRPAAGQHATSKKGRNSSWQQHHLFRHISDQSHMHAHENVELREKLRSLDRGTAALRAHVHELEDERHSIRAGQAVPSWVLSAVEGKLADLESQHAALQAEHRAALAAAAEKVENSDREAAEAALECEKLRGILVEDLGLLACGGNTASELSIAVRQFHVAEEREEPPDVADLHAALATRREAFEEARAAEARGEPRALDDNQAKTVDAAIEAAQRHALAKSTTGAAGRTTKGPAFGSAGTLGPAAPAVVPQPGRVRREQSSPESGSLGRCPRVDARDSGASRPPGG